MRTRESSSRSCHEIIVSLLGCLLALAFSLIQGCGNDDPEILEIYLNPSSLDFDLDDSIYFVDQKYAVLWRLLYPGSGIASLVGPIGGNFTPWGLDVGKEPGSEVLFISASTNTGQILLVINKDIRTSKVLDSTDILAQTEEGASSDPLTEVHGVASLYVSGDGYRVFVCDGSVVRVFKYDPSTEVLTYQHDITSPGTGACTNTFKKPFGVATDPGSGTDPAVLYVIDRDEDTLFRFIDVDGASPTCEEQVDGWTAIPSQDGDPYFVSPEGVGFSVQDGLIVVADSGQNRVVGFSWDGSNFVPTDLPATFNPYANASPFDLAFDNTTASLWATYPDSSAIAIPSR